MNLTRPTIEFRRNPMPHSGPDVHRLDDVVSEKILSVMREASAQLRDLGIRHAVAGGLAVGAWGYPRATKDVDFLVGDEAYRVYPSGLVTMSPGVPIQIRSVPIDSIPMSPGEGFLESDVSAPVVSDGIPIVSIEGLAFLKLKSPRSRDSLDLIELLRQGVDPKPIREYVEMNAPDLLGKFEAVVLRSQDE